MPECGLARDMLWLALGSSIGLLGLLWLQACSYRLWRRIKKRLYDKEARLNYMLREVGEVHLDCQEIGWKGGDDVAH